MPSPSSVQSDIFCAKMAEILTQTLPQPTFIETFLSQAATWLPLILGWVVVHQLTRGRERNKQKSELAIKLVQTCLTLESDVIKYHTNAERDRTNETRLVSAFKELASDLKFAGCLSDNTIDSYLAFKKSALMHNFMSTKFQSYSANNPAITNIAEDALEFRLALKQEISANYLSPVKFKWLSDLISR
jgi:hypothetical protein